MKKTVLSLGILAATLFHAAARADDPKPAPAPAMSDEEQALLRRFDTNHDGKLDESELAAAHEGMLKSAQSGGADNPGAKKFRAALVKRFDKNGDGKLDEAEQAEARQAVLQRWDTNHDGRLDENERAAMREELKAQAKALKLKN